MSAIRRYILQPASLLLGLALCLLPPARGDGPASLADPLPIRRVPLAPDQLAREMDRAKQGFLVKLPRSEFEERVRQATQGEAARRNPPRLVGAYYHAELTDGALVGACQWKVVHTADAPGLLPLTPLSLALREPRFENGDALIADFDGQDPSLLVETAGDHSVSVSWSARAEARPEGLHFDLRFPSSPAAVLEIDLPADKIVVAEGGGLSGPRPAGAADLNRWTLACGGLSQVSLTIRSIDKAPVLSAAVQTTQVLTSEGLDATYSFSVKSLHQGVRELVFECDADLRPFDVTAPGLEKCELTASKNEPVVLLTARLSQPLDEGVVVVHCFAPIGGPASGSSPVAWASPGVRLRGSVPGGETLVLKVHPDLRLGAVQPGGFRLKETGTETDGSNFQRLTFLGGGIGESGVPAGKAGPRPRAEVYPHGVEFRARQLAWWRVAPTQSSLVLETTYDVSRGRLFQLALRLPPDWEANRVELAPAGLLRDWAVHREKGEAVLLVNLQRSITPTEKQGRHGPTLTVELEPAHQGDILGKELRFPEAEALGARFREGGLAIGFDDQTHRLDVATMAMESAPDDDGPWGKEFPAYYYPYRELSANVQRHAFGTLTLRPRPPQVRAHCTGDVTLAPEQASVDARLTLEAEQGSPNSVDLYVSAQSAAPSGDAWTWRTEQGPEVRGVRRLREQEAAAELGPLAAGDAFGAVALLAVRPRGEIWRLTFARPLRVHEPVVLHAMLTTKRTGDRLEIPLVAVLGASRMEGEATLHLAAANPLQVETTGLHEASPASVNRPRGASAWRIFRYNGAAIGLTLSGAPQGGDRAADVAIDRASLITYVRPDNVLEHHYTFQASHMAQKTLPLGLPAGARLLAFQLDGVWSPRLPAESETADKLVLELPVPYRTGDEDALASHRYEVVYATVALEGWLWTRLEAPVPSLRTDPVAFHRLWRLAPEFSPLDERGLRRRPGPGEGAPAAVGPFQPADLLHPATGVPLVWPWPPRPEIAAQGALADALLSLRGKTDQSRTLGALVEETAAALRQRRNLFLVVDATALREAGVDPAQTVTLMAKSVDNDEAAWGALKLEARVANGGLLLTTRLQAAAWAADGISPEVDAAVGEAARHGVDPSGRFQAAPIWSGSPSGDKDALPSPQSALIQWTEWAPAPGAADADAVVVVRRPLFEAAGWTLMAVLGLLFLRLGWSWKRGRLPLLLLWLALSGLGLLWLPTVLQGLAWPAALAGCIFALAWRLWSATRGKPRRVGKARSSVAAAGAVALLLLCVCGLGRPADTAAPAPITVYLAPGPADAPDSSIVLAPPDLLDQLRAMTRPSSWPGAVLLNAEYVGEVAEGTARFDAAFQAVCLTDDATTLTVPLDGVHLTRDVLLDGAPVQATVLLAPQVGFTIPIKGRTKKGEPPHKVEVQFRTPATGTPDEHHLQFTAPRLVQSHMILHLPKGSTFIQASAKYGVQKAVKDDPFSIDIELGRVLFPLHIRWVPENNAGPAPARPLDVQLKEAYFWDLRADASSLTALLSYSISSGGAASLAVKLPAELETLAVEARKSKDGTPIRLRDWKVVGVGPERALNMEFASPISGELEVTLELAPRSPWPASFVLPLPAPVLPPSPQTGKPGRPKASFLAYRTQGLDVERVSPVGVTGVRSDEFAPFWPAASRPDARSLAYASTLLREDENRPPVLGLKVRPTLSAAHARLDLEVRVGPSQADVRAEATLTALDGDLSLVQWDLRSAQPFTVTGVTGPRVRRWNQERDHVLVWLDPPTKDPKSEATASLQLVGWLPLSTAGGATRLELPNLRLSSARSQETVLRLIAGNEVALTEVDLAHWMPVGPRKAGDVREYAAGERTDYGGVWQVHTSPADVRVYTVAGLRDRRLAFVAVVDCRPSQGEVQSLSIRVRNWSGEVRVDAPPGTRKRERRRGPDDRVWTLERDSGAPGPFRVTLAGDQTVEGAGVAAMPDVTVPDAKRVERWAAVGGTETTAEAVAGLTLADAPADLIRTPVAERMQPGAAWKITSPEWRLNLSPHDAAAPTAPIEVYLTDNRATVADGGHWLHETAYWLRHEANTDLNLTFPADAEVLSAAIDGVEAATLQAEPNRLWLPLTGRPAVCQVRVRWRYPLEEFRRPNLERLTLQGARESALLWTVIAPPGYEPEGAGGATALRSGLAQAAAAAWQRAEAQYRISDALASASGGAALADAQRRFYAECRKAQAILDVAADDQALAWPAGRTARESLQDLLQKNRDLAEKRHYEAVRAAAETATPSADEREAEGRPWYARADADQPAPELTLAMTEGRNRESVWMMGWIWLGVLALIAVLSLSSSVVGWMRSFWPEQIFLVGILGWWAAGATFVVLGLLLLGVGGRLLKIFQALGRLLRPTLRKTPSTVKPGAASVG